MDIWNKIKHAVVRLRYYRRYRKYGFHLAAVRNPKIRHRSSCTGGFPISTTGSWLCLDADLVRLLRHQTPLHYDSLVRIRTCVGRFASSTRMFLSTATNIRFPQRSCLNRVVLFFFPSLFSVSSTVKEDPPPPPPPPKFGLFDRVGPVECPDISRSRRLPSVINIQAGMSRECSLL